MKIGSPISLSLATMLGLLLAGAPVLTAQTSAADAAQSNGLHREDIVSIGHDVVLKAGDSAREVVAISGSATIGGNVEEDVVVVGGDAAIDGAVDGNVVVVMGTVHLGPKAVLQRDLVTVGGKADIADGAKVEGRTQEVNVGASLAPILRLDWLHQWLRNCAEKFRPLSLNVGWIWWVVGAFAVLYLLVAVLFQYPVECCANQVASRPATTFAVGVMAKILLPVLCLILPITVIGIFIVPFVIVGAMLCVLVGKVAVLEHFGGKVGAPLGLRTGRPPLAQFAIGLVLLTALYLVPVLGLFTAIVFSTWGFGAAVTTAWLGLRREKRAAVPVPPAPSPAPPPTAPAATAATFSAAPGASAPSTTAPTGAMPFAATPPGGIPASAPVITPPASILHPRAGFWERMGAGFLDMALLSVATALVGPGGILVAIAYFAGMWAWKGTTIGGIVLNLQVVREDGQPLSFLTALVRSIAAMFSILVLFLGFFWIGWDSQKQGWHDKIAGTVVVRLPKAIALVCL